MNVEVIREGKPVLSVIVSFIRSQLEYAYDPNERELCVQNKEVVCALSFAVSSRINNVTKIVFFSFMSDSFNIVVCF